MAIGKRITYLTANKTEFYNRFYDFVEVDKEKKTPTGKMRTGITREDLVRWFQDNGRYALVESNNDTDLTPKTDEVICVLGACLYGTVNDARTYTGELDVIDEAGVEYVISGVTEYLTLGLTAAGALTMPDVRGFIVKSPYYLRVQGDEVS